MQNSLMEDAAGREISDQRKPSLLETIRRIRARVGDALEDQEFTFFLLRQDLPAEAGFSFLCFHDGCVTLTVPPQDLAAWHPPIGWINPAKESIGVQIAEKHGLFLSEPLDVPRTVAPPGLGEVHHHLLLSSRKENLIIAHPEFLKLRLYATGTELPLPLAPNLLEHLAALYQPC